MRDKTRVAAIWVFLAMDIALGFYVFKTYRDLIESYNRQAIAQGDAYQALH